MVAQGAIGSALVTHVRRHATVSLWTIQLDV